MQNLTRLLFVALLLIVVSSAVRSQEDLANPLSAASLSSCFSSNQGPYASTRLMGQPSNPVNDAITAAEALGPNAQGKASAASLRARYRNLGITNPNPGYTQVCGAANGGSVARTAATTEYETLYQLAISIKPASAPTLNQQSACAVTNTCPKESLAPAPSSAPIDATQTDPKQLAACHDGAKTIYADLKAKVDVAVQYAMRIAPLKPDPRAVSLQNNIESPARAAAQAKTLANCRNASQQLNRYMDEVKKLPPIAK